MNPKQFRLEDLARLVQGEHVGQSDLILEGLASLDAAQAKHIAFVNADKYLDQARASKAGALIVTPTLKNQLDTHNNFIVVDNPYLAFAILTHVFEKKNQHQGIESTAQIHPSAIIADSAYIGHYVVIGEHCVVGDHTIIQSHVKIDDDVEIKDGYEYMRKSFNPNYGHHDIYYDIQESKEVIFFGLSFGSIDYAYFSQFFKDQSKSDLKRDESKYIRIFTYDEKSRMVQMNLMMNWFIVFAYLIPLIIASLYQFKVKNSKWYVSILIAILTHIVYAVLTLICTALTFDEIVQILY